MNEFAIKNIEVGKHSGRPIDPSDIEFQYYINDDKETLIITHRYEECSGHTLLSEEITNKDELDIASIYLLSTELSKISESLIKVGEYQYTEFINEQLHDLIHDGYQILSCYHSNDE